MRRWIPLPILLVLIAIASKPIWASAGFLSSYDGLLHVYRVFALDQALRQGAVNPRWLPDLAFGLGYPIYNYYPPLAEYIAETIHIFGFGFAQSLQATFILVIAIAATGAFMLGAELFRVRGRKEATTIGLVGSTAYIFFPYFMVNIYTRGAISEALAAALLPWLLWSLKRNLTCPRLSGVVLQSLLGAAMIVGHSLSALIVAPLVVAYCTFEILRLNRPARLLSLTRVFLAGILSLGLAAFYWLPFISELPLVRMGSGLDVISEIFATNFLPLRSLIQPSLFYTYGGPPVPLGLVPVAIGSISLFLALIAWGQTEKRALLAFFGIVSLLVTLAMSELTRAFWLAIPVSSMIQSVWRLTLLIGLCLSVIIGAMPSLLSSFILRLFPRLVLADPGRYSWIQGFTAIVVGVILIWTSTANLAPDTIVLPDDAFDLAHLARFEVSSGSIGTTTFGEYLPATLAGTDLTAFCMPMIEARCDYPFVQISRHSGTTWDLFVSASEPTAISLRSFDFPHWQARLDGVPTPVYSSSPLDLVTTDIPTGEHLLSLALEPTPVRWVGTVISELTALVLIGLTAIAARNRGLEFWISAVSGGLGLAVMVFPASVALTSSPQIVNPMRVSVTAGLDLIGLTVADAKFESEVWRCRDVIGSLHLRVYWHVKTNNLEDTPIKWRLVDDAGSVWAERAQLPRYGTAPQHTWMPNEILEDDYDLALAAPPAGVYTLQVAFGPKGPYSSIGRIEIAKSRQQVSNKPAFSQPANILFENKIRLLGYNAPPSAKPGSQYALELYWQAEEDVFEDFTVSAQVLDSEGQLVAQQDSAPNVGQSPTSLWIPFRPVADRKSVRLPDDLEPGQYALIVVVYRRTDLLRLTATAETGPLPDNAAIIGQVRILPK